MSYKYFIFPFAQDGEKTPLAEATQPSGTVSYQQGFGGRYSLPYPSDPNATPVPRLTFNEIMFDVTSAVQEYQQRGVPVFITPAMNGGPAFQYAKWAYALFDNGAGGGPQVYQSTVDANALAPTDGGGVTQVNTGWRLDDGNPRGNAIDDVVFDVSVAQNDVVYFDALTNTYKPAVANGKRQQAFLGLADLINRRVISFGVYEYLTGLTPGSVYYLSNTLYGKLTTTPPLSNIAQIGVALSSTKFLVAPGYAETGNYKPLKCNYAQVTFDSDTLQNIPFGPDVVCAFNKINSDENGWWDPVLKRFTPKLQGKYRITLQLVAFNYNGPNSGDFEAGVYQNDVFIFRNITTPFVTPGSVTKDSSSVIIEFNGTTDYIYAIAGNNFGAGISYDIGSVTPGPFAYLDNLFEIEYLGT